MEPVKQSVPLTGPSHNYKVAACTVSSCCRYFSHLSVLLFNIEARGKSDCHLKVERHVVVTDHPHFSTKLRCIALRCYSSNSWHSIDQASSAVNRRLLTCCAKLDQRIIVNAIDLWRASWNVLPLNTMHHSLWTRVSAFNWNFGRTYLYLALFYTRHK